MKSKKPLKAKHLAKKMVSPYDALGSWTGLQPFDFDYPEQDVDDL